VKKVSSVVSGILIEGSIEFIDATNAALTLIQNTPSFRDVKPYLAIIKEAPTSEMNVFSSQPTFSVGRPTWSAGAIWYGSSIIHDACHSKLYRQHRRRILCFSFTPLHYWTLKSGERSCIRVQLQALREMDCDTTCYQIFLQDYLIDPTYFDIPYNKRNW